MRRSTNWVVSGWPAILLTPLLFPLGLIAGLFSKPEGRTPADVAGFIRDLIDGTGGEWDWDEFECVPIADLFLESIRRRAIPMGPPQTDREGLERLIAEVRERFPDAV
jgi:hypothetical protein